jgi:hypothetical protein
MTKPTTNNDTQDVQPDCYAIRLKEQVSPGMLLWFEEFSIQATDEGEIILSGPIVDQSALHGVLARIRDLGLTLISVNRIKPEQTYEEDIENESASKRSNDEK